MDEGKHTELFPWVNQCGDGSEWLARAGTPYAVPELYSVKGPTGNASSMASSLLGTFDDWSSKSRRYDLKFWLSSSTWAMEVIPDLCVRKVWFDSPHIQSCIQCERIELVLLGTWNIQPDK